MKIIVIGGAGFIGSNCTRRLLERAGTMVTVYDDFSSGRRWHLEIPGAGGRLAVVEGDVRDLDRLATAMRGHEIAFHFASNPDIARAATDPMVDFEQGTLLTSNMVESARRAGVARVVFASGSGVFGDVPGKIFTEADFSACPTSTYAASKIAGETLLSAYAHMFGIKALSFRFANVVGAQQTHGVAYDFIRGLMKHPAELSVLGNGTQCKSYIHVDDVVSGLLFFLDDFPPVYDCFNLTSDDTITVREIADLVIEEMGLKQVAVRYGTSDRGWKGDVPRIRFSAEKMKARGWSPTMTSREAIRAAIRGMLFHARAGRLG